MCRSLSWIGCGALMALLACAPSTAGHTAAGHRAEAEPGGVGAVAAATLSIDSTLAVLTFDSAWSLIARAHYDTAYNGVDWRAVRDELRPDAARARTLPALRSVITDMVARLGESHFGLIPGEAATAIDDGDTARLTGESGIEVRLAGDADEAAAAVGTEAVRRGDELIVWRVAPGSAADDAGVRTGWTLVAIHGRDVAPRLAALAALTASERRVARTRLQFLVNALLTGGVGDTLGLRFRAAADTVAAVELVLRPREGEVITFGSLPPTVARLDAQRAETVAGCAGVIRFTMWLVPLAQQFDRAVDGMRDCVGIVIDLRGNPGGVAGMVMGTAGHFVNDTLPMGYMKTRTAELRFKANPRRVRPDGTRTEPFAGRVAVLTDELTASTSEFFAEGLQAVGRARVFGTRTAGQALPAMISTLPSGDALMYVIADFTGPRGTRIEGRGVLPDVVVETTRQDLLLQRDAPMLAALNWIAGGASGSHE